MTSILKAALVAAMLTGFSNAAIAAQPVAYKDRPDVIQLFDTMHELSQSLPSSARTADMAPLPTDARIGLVRVDGGRMIATPFAEADDWQALNAAVSQEIIALSPAAYLRAIPDIPMDGQDTDNKIDEIRLAAVDSGLPYVLIYGISQDAYFASFGGKHLRETGLKIEIGSPAWQGGDAKALLVDSYSGAIIDAVVTWRPDMPALTDAVKAMLLRSAPPAA